MISIKKYLDSNDPGLSTAVPESDELSSATMECYRSALLSIGEVALQISPSASAWIWKNRCAVSSVAPGNGLFLWNR